MHTYYTRMRRRTFVKNPGTIHHQINPWNSTSCLCHCRTLTAYIIYDIYWSEKASRLSHMLPRRAQKVPERWAPLVKGAGKLKWRIKHTFRQLERLYVELRNYISIALCTTKRIGPLGRNCVGIHLEFCCGMPKPVIKRIWRTRGLCSQ